MDLNDLRVFAYVASLASFSLAADALRIHKSSVSKSIARLEVTLESPLLQRTTRKVRLTQRGIELKERCVEILARINETIGYAGNVDMNADREEATELPVQRRHPRHAASLVQHELPRGVAVRRLVSTTPISSVAMHAQHQESARFRSDS
ncbi:MAG: LysR family transcriptional regulator [Variovorax sp.]|nr:MAG: LysR family transcriptional regulator [Variovorax sp.]